MSHQSQLFSREANSVECLTIRVHLASESPNPDNAPYRAAIVWQKHISSRKPIQLNRNATASERIWMTLLVRERERTVTTWVVWLTVNIRPTFWLMGLCTHRFTECHQVTHRGDSLQIWRVAANILTKQSQTADKGKSSSLAVGWRANNSSTCHNIKWCSFSGCLQHIFVKCSPKIWQSFVQPPQNWKCVIRYYDLNRSFWRWHVWGEKRNACRVFMEKHETWVSGWHALHQQALCWCYQHTTLILVTGCPTIHQ